MKGQVFSTEFFVYIIFAMLIIYSIHSLLEEKHLEIKKKVDTLMYKAILDSVFKEIEKWTINPGEINSSKINLSEIKNVYVKIYFQNGTVISNNVSLNCDKKIVERRFFLDEKDQIVVIEVKRCAG